MTNFMCPGLVSKVLRGVAIAGVASAGIVGVASAQAKPEPDLLVLKNGDKLTGSLEKGTDTNIVFKTTMAGEITISLDNVKELHAHESFAVLRKGIPVAQQAVHPGTLEYTDGTMRVESPNGNTEVPEKEIAYVVDEASFQKQMSKAGFFTGWTGSATAGLTDVQATNYGNTFTLGVGLVRAIPLVPYLPPRNKTTVDVAETYGKLTSPVIPNPDNLPPAVAKTSIFHADAERDEYFTPRFYALGDTAFDHNFAQGLDLQQVYGGGFGWTPFSTPVQELDLKFDVHYEKQQFIQTVGTAPVPDQNLIGSTFGESYRRTLPAKIQLTEAISLLPAWNNTNAYSGTGSLNLALPAWKRLTVNVGLQDSFLNNPAPGYNKNSFQFITGFGYTF